MFFMQILNHISFIFSGEQSRAFRGLLFFVREFSIHVTCFEDVFLCSCFGYKNDLLIKNKLIGLL